MRKSYQGNYYAAVFYAYIILKINCYKRHLCWLLFLISFGLGNNGALGNDCSSSRYLSPAASTDYFRSASSGSWSSASSWQSSADSIKWSVAISIPDNNARSIVIQNTHIITLTADATAKLLTIESGGTLTNTNASGGYLLTIGDDGTGTSDFNIYGSYILFGKAPAFNTGATATVYSGGLVRVDQNTGNTSETFASSASVLFKTDAVFEWNTTDAFLTKNAVYFQDISEIPIFRISNSPALLGDTKPTTFNGILEINSAISFGGSGLKIFRDGITGSATLTLLSSTSGYNITSSNAILGGSLKLILKDILHLVNGVTIPLEANTNVTGTGSLKNEGGSFLINGTIDISDVKFTISGGSNITLNGTLKTSRSEGLYNPGNISSGAIYVNDGSTIEYNGGNQDITSSATLGSPYYNIIFSGSGTKKPLSKIDVNTNGSVKITGASLVVDASLNNIGSTSTNTTNFIMDGGRLILGTSPTTALPLMNGNYNITGGIIEYMYSGLTTQTIRNKTYQNIEITGSNVGNSNGNITLNDLGTFTVKPTGVFSINDNNITGPTGTQTVTVENGGVFKCGNNGGFNGFTPTSSENSSIHPNIENIILEDGSTVEYTRAGDQPITNAGSLVYSNLTLSGSGNKTAPADILTLKGNFIKTTNSTFVHNKGTVVFNGNSAQLYSSISPWMGFYNVTNNNSVGLSINDSLSVYKQLLLGAGSKINLNAEITLLSDNDNTANVGPIPDNATITYNGGLFTVERYIPNHSKAWQFLASPTKGQTIKDAWQEGNNPGGNSKPGYGTQITSNLANATNLGFDLTSVNPSMKTYNSVTGLWEGVANTTYLGINNPEGYMLFVRGDRSVTSVNQSATATILRTTGKLYAPGIEAPATINVPANSFTSIGNPYASAIDFDKLIINDGVENNDDVENAYYIWDPQLTSSAYSAYGYGGYRTISMGIVVPASGNYADENNIPRIQSGQAFFVYGINGGTIGFNENSKVSGSTSIFRPAGIFTKSAAKLRVNLSAVINNEPDLVDGVLTQFDASYSNGLDLLDALKIANSGENISIATNGKNVSIERRQSPAANDTLFYNLGQMKQQQYQFDFMATHLDQYGMEAFLEDNYLRTKIPLNISGSTIVNFTVTNISGSSARDRFHIVFNPSAGPLPVTFASIKAYQYNAGIMVEWKVENESNLVDYTIEKSTDGSSFIFANSQPAKNASSVNYTWLDKNLFNDYNYYRIKSTGINGEIKYSDVVHVKVGKEQPSISVYPNPVVNGIINLQLVSQPAGNYKISLLNYRGQVIISKQMKLSGGNSLETFPLPKSVAHGIYQLEITGPAGEKHILKIKN